MLKDELLNAWWRLMQIPGVGRVTLSNIRQQLSSPKDLISCTTDHLIQLGLKPQAAQRWQQDKRLLQGFDQLQQWRQREGCGVLLAGIAPYPQSLSELRDAPPLLYYQGNLNSLQQPVIAMVGSRKPSDYASYWARQCARELAASGVSVISGLAMGIDGCVHQGAVETGSTIAVLGSGLDIIYPARHLTLAQTITERGLLLSEFPPGTEPQARHFPSRNRIISGLSLATVVVEAAIKSGSLITARQAADQGREVFALPGMVTNPLSHGCHQLIRDGAGLVQGSADILQELGLSSGQTDVLAELPSTPELKRAVSQQTSNIDPPALVTHVDFQLTSTDVIAIRSGLAIVELLPQLMELELDGWLAQLPGGYQRLK